MNRLLSFPTRILFGFLAFSFLVSCGGDEPVDPTPPTPVTPVDPNPPTPGKDTTAPTITVSQGSVNVITGPSVTISGDELKIGDVSVAYWKDDVSNSCKIELNLTPTGGTVKKINSGDKLSEEGKLQIKVTDEAGNSGSGEIVLTAIAVYGLENLANLQLQVDQVVNLLEGLTFAEGLTLQKVEVVQDGARTQVDNPSAFTPEYPGSIGIILTLARLDGSTIEVDSKDMSVKPLEYSSVSISNLAPADIVPIIGQVNYGDRKVYSYIEHLRVAEAVRVIEMMWEYGAGEHSRTAYQELMGKLNVGMTFEYPLGYDNYEIIEGVMGGAPDDHAYTEWVILNSLVFHANFKILGYDPDRSWFEALETYLKSHPSTINIFGNSAYSVALNESELKMGRLFSDEIKNLGESKNLILWAAGTNIGRKEGSLRNKIYNKDYKADEHGQYSLASLANSDKNNHPNCHLLVTIATNKEGYINQTNATNESSKFPIGFANDVLFSGRAFPYHDYNSGYIVGIPDNNGTSFPNYFNVALTSLCFQMFAEVSDVDHLLDMIRSTALTDYIRFDLNGDGDTNDIHDGHPETVPLQLINPAGFIKKYLMPADLPKSIGAGEVISLNKGYYKGVVFDIPGAEVKIGDEWIPFDSTNKDLILAQNPMNLTWRINGNLLKKMGYSAGQTVQGQILTVDDQWNGLRLEVPISIILQ